ncbi:TetR/AcrR family transcriptional regulator [Streptomyces sp. SCSIO ZS0520]|uniref:TetR/AcrR family transcriptional regulator n=1 Tax=Streptomyces sp. SCSIO ZS0520 TaxID=2892996 RepID=UPI0021DA295F|nr:TetR/AcrR family transcriptional regulator [Streptomyces sp. SCSIO ZS0520]
MPPANPEATRAALLSAALVVFAERTVTGTAVPVIAQQAKVATGTLYRHWPSKEALANAVYKEAKQLFGDYLGRGRAARPVTSPAELRAAFEAVWDNLLDFAEEQPASLAFLEHQQHATYLDTANQRLVAEVEGFAASLLRTGQRLGVVRAADPLMLTNMVFGAYVGLTKQTWPRPAALRTEAREAVWGLLTA